VTGYLERLAARASGAPAAVVPRLPSRFEGSPESNGDTAEELEAVAQARPFDETATTVAETRTSVPVGMRHPSMPQESSERTESADDRPLSTIRATPSDDRGASAETTAQDPALSRLKLPVASAALPRKGSGYPAAAIRAIVPAKPASSGLDESKRATASSSGQNPLEAVGRRDGSAASAPDIVHVSIGRVEVRASLTPTPTPTAALRPAGGESPDGTSSLHDYLRGRRSR
jgi:hypothetical protein